jgi:hypothetical protein
MWNEWAWLDEWARRDKWGRLRGKVGKEARCDELNRWDGWAGWME